MKTAPCMTKSYDAQTEVSYILTEMISHGTSDKVHFLIWDYMLLEDSILLGLDTASLGNQNATLAGHIVPSSTWVLSFLDTGPLNMMALCCHMASGSE